MNLPEKTPVISTENRDKLSKYLITIGDPVLNKLVNEAQLEILTEQTKIVENNVKLLQLLQTANSVAIDGHGVILFLQGKSLIGKAGKILIKEYLENPAVIEFTKIEGNTEPPGVPQS